MTALALTVSALLLGSGSAAIACTPIAFGKFKVGQRVPKAKFLGIPGMCDASDECTFNERSGIEYTLSSEKVAEVSAPVRLIRGLPVPTRQIDAAYARRVNRVSCTPFTLKRDDDGATSLETAEQYNPALRESIRAQIFFDERRTPLIAITSLPDN